MNNTETTPYTGLVTVAIIGAILGMGQLLASGGKVTLRYAFGRAIVSSGIATSAFAVLALIPSASLPLIVGLSCLLSSLGTTGLTMFASKLTGVDIKSATSLTPTDKPE